MDTKTFFQQFRQKLYQILPNIRFDYREKTTYLKNLNVMSNLFGFGLIREF
jgi:hypothetical protein